ncbi:MAG: hypothetical protein WCG45_04085 [bacterium]
MYSLIRFCLNQSSTTESSPAFYAVKWFKNGIVHRKDLPAMVYFSGESHWFFNGLRHREKDLPALIEKDGEETFFWQGEKYTFLEHSNGTKEYYNRFSLLHRQDSPAVIYANGDVEYWFDGLRHRLDGPAVICNGKQYFFEWGEFKKCIV